MPVEELEQESLIDYQVKFDLGLPESQKYLTVGEGENMPFEMTGMTIKLERKWFRYLVNYFIPSGIIAALSLVSFKQQTEFHWKCVKIIIEFSRIVLLFQLMPYQAEWRY